MTDESKLSDMTASIAERDGEGVAPAAIKARLEQVAWVVALLPPERRADCVIYLLEALDGHLDGDEFNDLVGDILLTLSKRMQFGLW